MKKLPISVFIISQDEEDRIAAAINFVKNFADEILVIDSGSKDKTTKIAKKLGAKVIFNKWQGYGQQKYFAESQCKNNWVINIDADEWLSLELNNEINELFKKNNNDLDNYAGFYNIIADIPHWTKKARFGIYAKKNYG